jgi:hypothetical protein
MSVFKVVFLKMMINKLDDYFLNRDLETSSYYACVVVISLGLPTINIIRLKL